MRNVSRTRGKSGRRKRERRGRSRRRTRGTSKMRTTRRNMGKGMCRISEENKKRERMYQVKKESGRNEGPEQNEKSSLFKIVFKCVLQSC